MKYATEEERKQAKREYDKQRYQANKEKKAEYYQINKGRIAEYNKQRYQDNREKILEQKKQYYQENKEKRADYLKQWRESNPNYDKQYNKQRYQTPMGRALYMAYAYKREDKKHNRGECTLTAQWIIDNIFNQKCIYCGESDWHKLGCDRKDNSLPHTLDNVVCSCGDCNNKRGLRPFEEFLTLMTK